ncbi:hypothetical protein [Leptolyngbya sp. 7M]|uniref:hypothetical protein n=1 Tax=Leptolyngbya sp. 7M TaxID=2812896 RepID=UPI001B8D32BC|nr:hypothetical protein [Leptolyngbya sp. 7M]QYO62900.1 hypothetical protein JVX88_23195 [Leptolyngbya sp. 7M]
MKHRRHRSFSEATNEPNWPRKHAAVALTVQPASALAKPVLAKTSQLSQLPPSPSAVALQWLASGKNLDFCLLAFCSCVLAILCHQTVHLPTSLSAPSSQLAASSRVLPADLDFTVKAGLFTSSQSRSDQDEEAAE